VRAVAITETGRGARPALLDVPAPEPGPGEVRVALEASALNHLDLWAMRGIPGVEYRFPFVLGADGAGTIDAVGAGVDEARIGEAVVLNPVLSCGRCAHCVAGERPLCRQFGMLGEHRDGTHADLVTLPAVGAVPRPADLDAVEAAAAGVVFATAFRMLFTKARARPGEVVLIHGVGGGVGTAALQLAACAGLEVVVTSSDPAKLERARELGAAHGVDYRQEDVVERVRAAVGTVDIVVDAVGAAVWPASFRLLRNGGRLVNCGATAGPEGTVPIPHLFWRQLEILGSTMASDGEFRQALAAVVRNGLRPVIDRVVPLESVPEALSALARGDQFGKIVVTR
jgi:NADPH:quinone reductase-like Zn-dependent oxidoreductase